ncbi:ATP-binding protein [[Eubacterium] cellulosolvens]
MIIHRLKVSGFGIIGDPLELSFPQECRLGILGQNEVGKTTILESIEYALYGLKRGPSPLDQRENIVTWGKMKARLEIEFSVSQDRFLLERVIDIKSGHQAQLKQITEGTVNSSTTLTSITEIESKIEQITGMDREAFTNLIYIKQKDLDALKDLAKAQRERLIDKVMGIDIFDTASEKVKTELKRINETLNQKKIRFEAILRNKKLYEEKRITRDAIRKKNSTLQSSLDHKKGLVNHQKQLLERYDWIASTESARALLTSLKAQLRETRTRLQESKDLSRKLKTYDKAYDEYKPAVERLETIKKVYYELELRRKEVQHRLTELNIKLNNTVKKMRLTENELKLFSESPEKKKMRLKMFIALMVIGLIFMIGGVSIHPMLSVIGLFNLVIALLVLFSYIRIDNLVTRASEIRSLKSQQAEREEELEKIEDEIEKQVTQYGFTTLKEVEGNLSTILDELNSVTKTRSIHALETMIKTAEERCQSLQGSRLQEIASNLAREIRGKEMEIQNLEKKKPPAADQLPYNRSYHNTVKRAIETIQEECNTLEKEIHNNLGIATQLDYDLDILESDYQLYPELKNEIGDILGQLEVRTCLLHEFFETARDLRNKVIPYARFIINRILPTLTNDRYSDFQITEDLKFTVHTSEVRGYKEREIFSGGTQDQFLIALRLAFTQSILDSRVASDRYSLLMDECTSSSDDIRKQGIFEVLEAMKKTFSQIFIIAHEDISDFVDHYLILERNRNGYTKIRSKSWQNLER